MPTVHALRDLGASLIPTNGRTSARDRILFYLRANVGQVAPGDECMIVAGISDHPRRGPKVRDANGSFGLTPDVQRVRRAATPAGSAPAAAGPAPRPARNTG